ncbi:MAG: recombinase RecA [Myxococcales bacterium]|nr:recombinase RecA [Myxococcales bacterium]
MSRKSSDPRHQALDLAITSIERQFGKGAIMRLGDDNYRAAEVEVIPTGTLGIDSALGIGGLPKGRITEIYGPESSGKTTLALHVLANCQKQGGVAAFVDAEHALDVGYARTIGVNTDNLLVAQPDTGEQALDIVDTLVRSGAVDCIVVDSVAALVPKAEIEGDMGDTHVGLQARLMSQALRKLTASVSRSSCSLIFLNQLRMKIGVMFGNPETTTGGNALKFYSSIRLDIRRITSIKAGDEMVGNRTRLKVVKNKMAAPFRKVEFDIMFDGTGISAAGDLLDHALEHKFILKSGSWFSLADGERIGQGRENARAYLKQNHEIAQELDTKLRVALGLTRQAAVAVTQEEGEA